MLVLVITNDDKLVNKVKAAGHNPMKCTAADRAPGMLKSGEFDAVIVGPPFTDIETNTFRHDKVFKVRENESLPDFFISREANLFENLNNEEDTQPRRKMRSNQKDDQTNPSELGKVLLVTTNIVLAKYLSEFNLKIVTNALSAKKVLDWNPKIIIWDLPDDKVDIPDILTYKWGEDLRHAEDIIEVLSHIDLHL